MPIDRPPADPSRPTLDQRAETLWKWALRLVGLSAFVYVLIQGQDVPVAVYVLIGGLIGLPNVVSLQQLLNQRKQEP